MKKKGFLFLWLTALSIAIGYIFWRVEYIYSLPTKVPEKYIAVQTGSHVSLPFKFNDNKPVFLHFFNPDCPCSRFNISYFKELLQQYSSHVHFAMVVLSSEKGYDAKKIKAKYGIDIAVYTDSAIAAATGVYSTPQAAIITADHRLFYRGNYNKSRYCTSNETKYAEISLKALLSGSSAVAEDYFASRAYGCVLPKARTNY